MPLAFIRIYSLFCFVATSLLAKYHPFRVFFFDSASFSSIISPLRGFKHPFMPLAFIRIYSLFCFVATSLLAKYHPFRVFFFDFPSFSSIISPLRGFKHPFMPLAFITHVIPYPEGVTLC
jgi:hypothetical protein